MSSFEKLFYSKEDKIKEITIVEKAVQDIRKRIKVKEFDPEEKNFFNQKDQENLKKLNSHPDSDEKTIFQYSRVLMHQIKKNPDLVNKKIRYYHPKKI